LIEQFKLTIGDGRFPVKFGPKDKESTEYMEKRPGVGGSDIPKIFDLFPGSRNNLFLEKTGQKEKEDLSQIEAVESGIMFEPVIRNKFAENFPELRVYDTTGFVFASPEYPDCYASVDGLVYHPERGWGILEVKNVSMYMGARFGKDSVPEHMNLQVQYYMRILGVDYTYFAVHAGGQKKIYRHVKADKELQDEIYRHVYGFLKRVHENEPYEETRTDEIVGEKDDVVVLDVDDLLLQRDSLLMDKKLISDKISVTEEKIKRLMGDRTKGETISGRHISYPEIAGRQTFDVKSYLAHYPEEEEKTKEFWKEGKPYRRLNIEKID
jgi:hypothetical protein